MARRFVSRCLLVLVVAFALGIVGCRPTPTRVNLPLSAVVSGVASGDKLTMEIVGEERLPTEFEVSGDGSIAFPFINRVMVEGMEKHEIEALVRDRLIAGQFYDDPVVVVTIKEFKSKLVTVAGEVKKPNSFPFVPGMTLTSVIARAAGMTPLAIRYEVKVVRKTKNGIVDAIVDYDAINNNQIKDVPLQPGDNITVPRSPF